MIDLPAPYRQATQADAPALSDLVDFAGEGLPSYLWARCTAIAVTARA